MTSKHRSSLAALALTFASLCAAVTVQGQDSEVLRTVLAAPERSAEDKERDRDSKPIEVVAFLGVESGMTALDVIAAGGYWTEVLSGAVGSVGRVYSQNPEFFVERGGDAFRAQERARAERLGNIEPIHGNLSDADIGGSVDVAITSLNYHDLHHRGGDVAGAAFLRIIHQVLRPGGVLGVIDHVGVAGQDNAGLHRVEPEAVKRALEAAGFTVESESDLLANPRDDHERNVRDESLDRSDKMLIRARKPT